MHSLFCNTVIQSLKIRKTTSAFLLLTVFFMMACTGTESLPPLENVSSVSLNPDSMSVADSVNFAFNYKKNKEKFQLTFLEFGATGCIDCIKMEKVMDSVKVAYGDKVRVVFYHVRSNKKLSRHYDIKEIPVQILLDREAVECFRHKGYISFKDIENEIAKHSGL